MNTKPIALTIAGSDSGGGAGIQADLKTFAAFQVYGACVITAITAQNTLGVRAVEDVSTTMIAAQIKTVLEDLEVNSVKIGMLSNSATIKEVSSHLNSQGAPSLVLDPVMIAKGGDPLLRMDAVNCLKEELLPKSTVVTPNSHEATVLSGVQITTIDDAKEAARVIFSLGPRYVVVKGGHFGSDAVDLLFDGVTFTEFTAPRVPTRNTHGTGCTFASAICSGLAWNLSVEEAVSAAKSYVFHALETTFPVGHGHGPLNHFYHWWQT